MALSKSQVKLRSQALLIGPSYDLLPARLQLDGTEADLNIMRRIISRDLFRFEHIKELTGQNATKSNILSSFAEITRNAERESTVMVYYSGHGWCWTGGARAKDRDQGLLPADTTPEHIESGTVASMCVTGEDMRDYLVQLSKKRVSVTIMFDCCFSGHMYRGPEFDEIDFKCIKAREVTLEGLLKIKEGDTASPSTVNTCHSEGSNRPKRVWRKVSDGWLPHHDDKFFHLAACSSIEKAWEGVDSHTRRNCGLFTSTLGRILETWDSSRGQLSYNALFSLIQRHFKIRGISYQTPQMEGANLDTILFGSDVVRQSTKLVNVDDVITDNSLVTVQLNAGYLQLLHEGQYDIYEPTVQDSHIDLQNYSNNEFWVGAIDVSEQDIDMTTAIGHVIEQGENKEILPGCKAHLRQKSGSRISVAIVSSSPENDMKMKLEETQMFRVFNVPSGGDEYAGPENEVVMRKELIEGEEHWCARMKNKNSYKMIVPPVYPNQHDDIMVSNLEKYFRFRLALTQPPSNDGLLLNVDLKVSRLRQVKAFGRKPDLRNERLEEAMNEPDIYAEYADDPSRPRPRFLAHKLKKIFVNGARKEMFEDETGDAVVVRVTNNEEFPIYVVLLMYQLDGAIVAMYPPRRGATITLSPGESVADIHRIGLPDNALLKFQPDPSIKAATEGIDTIMLYATSSPSHMGPLLQPAIDLGGKLKAKGGPGKNSSPLEKFLTALKDRCLEGVDEPEGKWLIEKREFVVEANN